MNGQEVFLACDTSAAVPCVNTKMKLQPAMGFSEDLKDVYEAQGGHCIVCGQHRLVAELRSVVVGR